jgi:predicted TPR repeat methyltransferase
VTRPFTFALAVLLVAGLPAAGQEERAAFATATVDDVGTVAFGLLRTGAREASGEELSQGATVGRAAPHTVSRVIWDRTSGVYFGYEVDVTRAGASFRLEFRPLRHEVVLEQARPDAALRVSGAGGTPPRPLATTPRFPPPQTLGEGELLTLELLSNPTTGSRIFDVLKVSADPISANDVQAAVTRAHTGQMALFRAAALVARGRYWAAADAYRKALEILPRDAAVHNKLGICYQQLGNHVMARRSYDRALELNPQYAEVWNNIGTLEQSAERLKAAVEAYKKAIRLRSDLATPWKNLGNAYLALEKPEEAFEAYEEAFRLDPTIVETQGLGIPAVGVDAAMQRFYIAKLLAANGHVDAALEFLRRAREAGFTDFDRVRQDPDFKAVVEDARFEVLFGS